MDIDWDKPYGVVYGVHAGRYEQDGLYFDIHGKQVKEESSGKDVEWAKKQKGLGGRNLLIDYAKNVGIQYNPKDKIESLRNKVIAHMS